MLEENKTAQQAPETTDENKVAEGFVGELAPAEMVQLQQLQAQANAVYNHIGQLEVKKASLLGRIGAIEAKGQEVMDGIAQRCGIERGTPWRITPDNKVQVVPNVAPFPGSLGGE